MKKNFIEAEVEIELLTTIEDIMFESPVGSDLGTPGGDDWDEG